MSRLRKSYAFKSVFKDGNCLSTKNLTIYYKESETREWRYGLVVSKRVGNAVRRNRIKRQLREAFRKLIIEFEKEKTECYDTILIAKPKIFGVSFNEIVNELRLFFERE